MLGDQLAEGGGGLTVLLVLQPTDAQVVLCPVDARVAGVGFEKLGPLVGREIVLFAVLQGGGRRELPGGGVAAGLRLVRLLSRCWKRQTGSQHHRRGQMQLVGKIALVGFHAKTSLFLSSQSPGTRWPVRRSPAAACSPPRSVGVHFAIIPREYVPCQAKVTQSNRFPPFACYLVTAAWCPPRPH